MDSRPHGRKRMHNSTAQDEGEQRVAFVRMKRSLRLGFGFGFFVCVCLLCDDLPRVVSLLFGAYTAYTHTWMA